MNRLHAGTRRVQILRLLISCVFTAGICALVWPQTLGGHVAYVRVDGHSMDGTYSNGDLVIVRQQAGYHVGEIVAYRIPKGEFGAGAQVVHRIIGGNGKTGFTTKGDNKPLPDEWHPRTADVVGGAWIHIPGVGTKLGELAAPLPLGAFCALLTVGCLLAPDRKRRAATPIP